MISHVLSTVQRFSPEHLLVVVDSKGHEMIPQELDDEGIRYIIQPEAFGTADAARRCRDEVTTRRVMVLCGDVPLLRSQTLSDMIALHQSRGAAATLLSTEFPDPSGYGRIVRNGDGTVLRIVEDKDASSVQRAIREINSGTYIFESSLLFDTLELVEPSPATGEYYLTDVVAILVERGMRVEALKIEDSSELMGVEALKIEDSSELMGVNDPAALKRVEDIFRRRLLSRWRRAGARIEHPHMVFADSEVELAAGAQVNGRTVLRGSTRIGPGSRVGPFVTLEDTVVEGNSCIKGLRSKGSSS
jgi:bifunctional UDP-N-acetylglucosamine pyrophosphorylase/glucosamine-1-phosphate N-acetyltransferase